MDVAACTVARAIRELIGEGWSFGHTPHFEGFFDDRAGWWRRSCESGLSRLLFVVRPTCLACHGAVMVIDYELPRGFFDDRAGVLIHTHGDLINSMVTLRRAIGVDGEA